MGALELLCSAWHLDSKRFGPGTEVPNVVRTDLACLFQLLQYKVGVEVGVEGGKFSEVLCRENPGVQLYAVDTWRSYDGYREHVSDEHYDSLLDEAKRRLAPYHVSFVRDYSVPAASGFEDQSLDFVYLDANHTLPHVIADLAAWEPKVRVGGIISGHDYSKRQIGKTRADQLHVIEAVHAWTTAYKINPWFILGSAKPKPGERSETYRSWCWVKRA